jgi:hypothetical protein
VTKELRPVRVWIETMKIVVIAGRMARVWVDAGPTAGGSTLVLTGA